MHNRRQPNIFLFFFPAPFIIVARAKSMTSTPPPALAHEGTGRFYLNFTRKKVAVCSALLRALLTFFEFSSKTD